MIPVTVTGVPSRVYVTYHGEAPVKSMLMFGSGLPVHTVPPPLNVALGNIFTITLAVPLLVPVQFISLTLVTAYVPTAAPEMI